MQQRLPQPVEKIMDDIYREALAENNVAQLVKAHLYRSASMNTLSALDINQKLKKEQLLFFTSCFYFVNV